MSHKYGTLANNFQRFAFIGSMSLTGDWEFLLFREIIYVIPKAPESAMKTISFVLMEDLLCHFLHSTQLEDKHSQMILQTGVSTVTLLFIQMLLPTDLSSPCGSHPWLDNKSVPIGQ